MSDITVGNDSADCTADSSSGFTFATVDKSATFDTTYKLAAPLAYDRHSDHIYQFHKQTAELGIDVFVSPYCRGNRCPAYFQVRPDMSYALSGLKEINAHMKTHNPPSQPFTAYTWGPHLGHIVHWQGGYAAQLKMSRAM